MHVVGVGLICAEGARGAASLCFRRPPGPKLRKSCSSISERTGHLGAQSANGADSDDDDKGQHHRILGGRGALLVANKRLQDLGKRCHLTCSISLRPCIDGLVRTGGALAVMGAFWVPPTRAPLY